MAADDFSLAQVVDLLPDIIASALQEFGLRPGKQGYVSSSVGTVVAVGADGLSATVQLAEDEDGDQAEVQTVGTPAAGDRVLILHDESGFAAALASGGGEDDDIEEGSVTAVVDADTVTVLLADGSTVDATLLPTGGGAASPLTTKGDVWGYDTADARIPIGSDAQVLTVDSAQSLGLKWADAPAAPGVPIVRKFPWAFDDANILTGATFYTPTAGDVLLDVWVQMDVECDGAPSYMDIGPFDTDNHGFWFRSGAWKPINLSVGSPDFTYDNTLLIGKTPPLSLVNALNSATQNLSANLGTGFVEARSGVAYMRMDQRTVPGLFVASPQPLKVCISDTGRTTGSDPGNTQGSGFIYLMTVTPV